MTKYRVVKSYWERSVGDFVVPGEMPLWPVDAVALELGALEKVEESVAEELAGYLSTFPSMHSQHPSDCIPLAKAAIEFFKGRMPCCPEISIDSDEAIYKTAIADVSKALFGESDLGRKNEK